MVSTPEVAGDLLFIGSCAGVFYALDKNTGAVRWSYDVAKGQKKVGFHGNPYISEDLVVIGTDINGAPEGVAYVYAFERASGKERWKSPARRGIASDITRIGTSLYGVTLSDEIISIDLASGRQSWAFSSLPDRGDRIPASPAAGGDNIFYGDRDGGLYSIDPRTGKIVWKREFTTPVSTSLVAAGGSLLLGAANHLYRIDQRTGAIEGHFLADGWSSGRPVVTGDSILFFVGNTITSLDLSLKKVNWKQRSRGKWTTPRPLLLADTVLAGNDKGEVIAYRITDGAQQWCGRLDGVIRSIGHSNRVLYIGTREGTVYAYREQTLNP